MKKTNSNFVDFFFAKTAGDKRASRAIIVAAIVLVVVILCNIAVAKLSSSFTEIDLSSNNLYKVSDEAKEYLDTLEYDIELILVGSEDSIDQRISKYVNNYAALSNKVSLSTEDPYKNTSILETYDCTSSCLVVNCDTTGKSTYIPFTGSSDAIIVTTYNNSTGATSATEFDADGQITSAVDYVTNETSNGTVYMLAGHNESPFPTNVSSLIKKSNLTISESPVNLLKDKDGIPEDCGLMICYNPTTDLAKDEVDILRDYMSAGGDLMIFLDVNTFENFNAILAEYGLEVQQGYVGDLLKYYYNYASYYGCYCFAPEFNEEHPVTAGIKSDGFLLYPIGMLQTAPARDTITVTPFMTTSDHGTSYIDEENYVENVKYILGADAVEQTAGGESRLTVVSAISLIDDQVTTAYPNMANTDIFMNAVTESFDDIENISIPPKSLTVSTNTVSGGSFMVFAIMFIGVIPIVTIVCGIVYCVKRKKA